MPKNTSGLNPQAAAKGNLRQCSIQLHPHDWASLDALVEKAKAHPDCTYSGRIGRGDIIGGLLLAMKMQEQGVVVPVELIAIGVLHDGDGDCLVCGGPGYLPGELEKICPLCDGRG